MKPKISAPLHRRSVIMLQYFPERNALTSFFMSGGRGASIFIDLVIAGCGRVPEAEAPRMQRLALERDRAEAVRAERVALFSRPKCGRAAVPECGSGCACRCEVGPR